MEEEQFYTGAIEAPYDDRHYGYDEYVEAFGAIEIDWERGFDIRDVFGSDFEIKDQKKTLSCVGQAWSYQAWAYQVIEAMKMNDASLAELQEKKPESVQPISAKAIYSQIHIPSGGAYIYKGGKLLANWGALFEKEVPFYREDGTVDEKFARDKSWMTPERERLAQVLKGKHYRIIRALNNMDLFAQAIIENMGVVGGVRGANGHGWNSERPRPPSDGYGTWGHCIWYPAFGTDERGRFIATPNSWGRKSWSERWKKGSRPGTGWQKLYIDYFKSGVQFDPWTYTDIPNQELTQDNMFKLIRDPKTGAIYAIMADNTKSHILTMKQIEIGVLKGLWKREWEDVAESELNKYQTTHSLAFIV